MVNNYNIFTIQ